MKYRKVAYFSMVSALFFLFACAHVTGPGEKSAILHVPQCLEWLITASQVRGIIANSEGVSAVYVDAGTGNVMVGYDSTKTSAEKLAKTLEDRGYSVDSIKVLD